MTGITPQFSEDIERWSSITFPNKKSTLYKQIGNVELRLLDPSVWAIGKLTRFLPHDERDLRIVLRKNKSDPKYLARFWGRALGLSGMSSTQDMFRRQVLLFFKLYARSLWGPSTHPDELKTLFLQSAQKTRKKL